VEHDFDRESNSIPNAIPNTLAGKFRTLFGRLAVLCSRSLKLFWNALCWKNFEHF